MTDADIAERSEPWVPVDTWSARLALVRSVMGWNVKEAADACGVNPQSWHNWEGGGGCRTMETVSRRVADATGCDYVWLMAGGPLRNRCFSVVPEVGGQLELSFRDAPLLVAV